MRPTNGGCAVDDAVQDHYRAGPPEGGAVQPRDDGGDARVPANRRELRAEARALGHYHLGARVEPGFHRGAIRFSRLLQQGGRGSRSQDRSSGRLRGAWNIAPVRRAYRPTARAQCSKLSRRDVGAPVDKAQGDGAQLISVVTAGRACAVRPDREYILPPSIRRSSSFNFELP